MRCTSDSDPSEAPSVDSDDSSAAPPRRHRASQKNARARSVKVRTLNRWTTEEHDKLAYLVDKWGSEKNWAKVAEEMPGRTGKQCRERWLNHMKPGIIKGNWSSEEEFLLAQCHALVGSHWSKMTKRLPGRTENSIKNFWNATLRSKAPNKKRGMLWTYMQMHDPKSDDNTLALLTAVSRLHESRELPPALLAQLDAQLLDARGWKAVHKAEKDFLENVGGELHYLALPHPAPGSLAASAAAAAAGGGPPLAFGAAHSAAAVPPAGSPDGSPGGSGATREYAPALRGGRGGYRAQRGGGGGGDAPRLCEPDAYGAHAADDGSHAAALAGLLSCPGLPSVSAAGPGHHHHLPLPGAAGFAAMGALLTAQDPLLSCVPDGIDHAELLKLFETGGVTPHGAAGGALVGAAPLAGGGAPAGGDLGVLPPPKELAPIVTLQLPLKLEPADGSGPPGSKASTLTAADAGGACGGLPHHHLSPVTSCEPGGSATSMHGGQLLSAAAGGHDQQYANAALAEFARRQAGAGGAAAGYDAHRSADTAYAGSRLAGGRAAGGHGPQCSCGPCSNSRKLHGLHSPSARRNARSNTAGGAAAQRFRGASDVAGPAFGAAGAKLQRKAPPQSDAGAGAPGGWHGADAGAPGGFAAGAAQQQLFESIQASLGAGSGGQQEGFQAYFGPGASAQRAGKQQQPGGSQEPRAESPFAQQAAWAGPALGGGAELPTQGGGAPRPAALLVPGLTSDALTGFLLSPLGLGLLSPLGGLMLPPSTRSVRLPSFGQITLARASINGADWDWDALLGADLAHSVRSARPSETGDAGAAAGASAPPSVPRSGTKRARASLTSVDDEAALLIDMAPAKAPRTGEAAPAGTIFGCGGAWPPKDAVDRL
ncbi:MYB119 [Scenedesmus sp. PABB004]|nr:MYB119 [Scenedesmus sp. PABB004]